MMGMQEKTKSYLDSLGMYGWQLGLDRMWAIAEALGHPQHCYRSIHIAGSNGKGSVARMLERLFLEAGIRTGLYTSPHLITPLERIRINGEDILPDQFEAALWEYKPLFDSQQATYFEVLTALAFHLFAQMQVELAIVEVGLGGRLDATNILTPTCSVITSISLEHTKELGNTIDAIATEKAGIVKPGVPCCLGELPEPARDRIQAICAERGAELILASAVAEAREIIVEPFGSEFQLLLNRRQAEISLPLPGRHQVDNARLAVCAASTILPGDSVLESTRRALATLQIPGRFQVISNRPLQILDVAHNPDSFLRLLQHLDGHFSQRRVVLVAGFLADKDSRLMLEQMRGRPYTLICTQPHSERALAADALYQTAQACELEAEVESDIVAAVGLARVKAGYDGVVVVTGSHYVVGPYLQNHLKKAAC